MPPKLSKSLQQAKSYVCVLADELIIALIQPAPRIPLAYYLSGPGPSVTINQHHTGDEYKKDASPRAVACFLSSYTFDLNREGVQASDPLTAQPRFGKWIHFERDGEPTFGAIVRLALVDVFHQDKDEARIEVWVKHSAKVRNELRLTLPIRYMPFLMVLFQDKPDKEAIVSEFVVPVDRRKGYITTFVCSLIQKDVYVEMTDDDSFDHHLALQHQLHEDSLQRREKRAGDLLELPESDSDLEDPEPGPSKPDTRKGTKSPLDKLPFRLGSRYNPVHPGAPADMVNDLQRKLDSALKPGTKANYATAVSHLTAFFHKLNMEPRYPMEPADIGLYMLYLEAKGIGKGAIMNYLDGIRYFHLTMGLEAPPRSHPVIKYALSQMRNSKARPRVPILPGMLRSLKSNLAASAMNRLDKLAYWALATLTWHGFMRISEATANKAKSFDRARTLLWRDITVTDQAILVTIKSSKTDTIGRGHVIKIHATGSDICPVRAMIKYQHQSTNISDQPVFTRHTGNAITKTSLNKILHQHCDSGLAGSIGKVTSHSLRSGAATTARLMGWTDTQIMGAGRWRSDAFRTYVALPETTVIPMMVQLSRNNGRL